MNSILDWEGQLEVVDNGATWPADIVQHDTSGIDLLPYQLKYGKGWEAWFYADGRSCLGPSIWAQNKAVAPSEAPQTPTPILPSTEQLDRFEALLMRLEGILGGINKGEEA